jgi:D-amino-acid dehydrogenase
MKIVIMGGGVIGVTSAYFLARDGHEVTVLDRQPVPANETSFANAGLVAPGHSYAWAQPQVPMILLRSLWRNDQALRLKFNLDPRMWLWGIKFLAQCTAEKARINTTRKLGLCVYSQNALHGVVQHTNIAYDQRANGCIYLYRTPAALEKGVLKTKILAESGQKFEVVDGERAAEIDPIFRPVKDKIAGGIYCPTDESGDVNMFTRGLAELCQRELGVSFEMETTIRGIDVAGGRVERIITDKGDFTADHYVLSLGSYSPFVARKIGINLPIYPVKGYSVTLPVGPEHEAPTLGGVDEENLVAFTRMGDRLRLTATAEFSGYDTTHKPSDFATMLAAARDLFPNGGDYSQPTYWAGLRPMTPEGTPIFGYARYDNLYLNTGHGHMGWTMSCGAGKIAADLIAGRKADIDLAGMTLQ